MKQNVAFSLVLSTLLLLGLISPTRPRAQGSPLSPALAQDQEEIVVQEEEPNDTPLTAQVIPFPRPGEKVAFRGRIARGDKGSRSEELEAFFSQFDLEAGEIQDWIVIDPDVLGDAAPGDGPIPLRITADWGPVASPQQAQQGTNLDFWVGTLVDDQTFFVDGFKAMSDIQMVTGQRPESWPRHDQPYQATVLYLQPKDVPSDGEPLPNDGFARKLVIGIQHFSGPAAEYTVMIENLASTGTERASSMELESHQIDDGLFSALFFGGPPWRDRPQPIPSQPLSGAARCHRSSIRSLLRSP